MPPAALAQLGDSLFQFIGQRVLHPRIGGNLAPGFAVSPELFAQARPYKGHPEPSRYFSTPVIPLLSKST